MKRPNILWICTDQQRWDTLGCYGNSFVKTPNLDRLSREGMLFDRCYSQSPVCAPSRASFLTGRYPRTTRCRQNGQNLPATEMLVTKLLAASGYACGLAGKLHISACEPTVCEGVEPRINDGYTEFHWSHHPDREWPADTHNPYNEYHRWLEAQGAEFRTTSFAPCRYVRTGVEPELHQTTWCAEKAIRFMETQAKSDQPWLFSVNIFDPHHDFDPPAAYLKPYLDKLDAIPLPNYQEGELANKPPYQAYDHDGAYGHRGPIYSKMTDTDHRYVRAAYWAMCDLIDAQVGCMLAALDETAQRDNTIVIFTSDHGEMLGDHGIYLKGPYFYEPAIHVPLILSAPSHIAPRRNAALVELTDLAPTLLDAAGLPRHPGMQGKSLWPILTGKTPTDRHRDDVYCEYYNSMPWHKAPAAHLTMVRDEKFKLIVDHSGTGGELYDLRDDPTETHNLWNDPAAADRKTEMLVRLCNRMAWTTDPLPPRKAPW